MKHYAIVTDVIRDEPFGVVVKEGTHNVCHGFHEAGYEWADLYNTGAVKALHDGLPPGVELGNFGPLPLDTEDLLSKSPQDIPTPKSFHLVESEWLENDSLGPAIKDVGLRQMPQESRQLAIDYKAHAFLVESSRSSMLLAVRLAGGGFTPDNIGFRSKTADRHQFSHLALGDSHTRRIAKDVLNSKMLILSQPYRFTDVPETDIDTKALGRKLGGNLARGGRRARRAAQMFDPNAIDADMDLLVQEGTPWERPVMRKPNLPSLPGTARSRAADRTPKARATAARAVRDRRGLRSARDLRGDMPDEGIDLSPAQERLISRLRDDTLDTTLGDLYSDPTTPTSVTNAIENFTGLDKDDTDPIWNQKLSDISDTTSANILDLMEADVQGDPEKYFGQRYTRGLASVTDISNSHGETSKFPGPGVIGPEMHRRLGILRDNGFHIYKGEGNNYKLVPPDRIRNAHRLQSLRGQPGSNPKAFDAAIEEIAAELGVRPEQLDVGNDAHWKIIGAKKRGYADLDFLGMRQGRTDARSMMSFHPDSKEDVLINAQKNWLRLLVGNDPDDPDVRLGDDLIQSNLEDIARTGKGPLGYIPQESMRQAPRGVDGKEKLWSPVQRPVGGGEAQRRDFNEAARNMAIARARKDRDVREDLFQEARQNARRNPSPTNQAELARAGRDFQEAQNDLIDLEAQWTDPTGGRSGPRSRGPDPEDFDASWNQAREESDNHVAGLLDSISGELEQAEPDFEKVKASHVEVLDAIDIARKRGLRSILRDGDDDYTPDPDRWHDDPFERDRAINSSIFGDRMDGMSIDDAAEKYGVNRHEVRSREIEHMEELAGQERYNAQPNLNQRIFDDRMDGMSLEDAAKKYDVDRVEIRAREITHSNALGGQERYNAQPNLNQRIYRDRMQGLSLDQVGRRYAMDRDEVRSREITHMGSDGRGLASRTDADAMLDILDAEPQRRYAELRKIDDKQIVAWAKAAGIYDHRKNITKLRRQLAGLSEPVPGNIDDKLQFPGGRAEWEKRNRVPHLTPGWRSDGMLPQRGLRSEGPKPEANAAKTAELNRRIDTLRKSKLQPWVDRVAEAKERGDDKATHSLTKELRGFQEEEAELREQLGEAMGKGRVAIGLRSQRATEDWDADWATAREESITEMTELGEQLAGELKKSKTDRKKINDLTDKISGSIEKARERGLASKGPGKPWQRPEPDSTNSFGIDGPPKDWARAKRAMDLHSNWEMYPPSERGEWRPKSRHWGDDDVEVFGRLRTGNMDAEIIRGENTGEDGFVIVGMFRDPDSAVNAAEYFDSGVSSFRSTTEAQKWLDNFEKRLANDLDPWGDDEIPAVPLPDGLQPGDIVGQGASWDGRRHLRELAEYRRGERGLASRGTSPDSAEGGRAIERALGEARDMTVADLSDDRNMLSRAGNEKLWRLLPDDMEEGHPDWDKPIRDLDLGEQVLGVIEEDFYDDPGRIISRYEGAGPDTVEEARGLRSRGDDPEFEREFERQWERFRGEMGNHTIEEVGNLLTTEGYIALDEWAGTVDREGLGPLGVGSPVGETMDDLIDKPIKDLPEEWQKAIRDIAETAFNDDPQTLVEMDELRPGPGPPDPYDVEQDRREGGGLRSRTRAATTERAATRRGLTSRKATGTPVLSDLYRTEKGVVGPGQTRQAGTTDGKIWDALAVDGGMTPERTQAITDAAAAIEEDLMWNDRRGGQSESLTGTMADDVNTWEYAMRPIIADLMFGKKKRSQAVHSRINEVPPAGEWRLGELSGNISIDIDGIEEGLQNQAIEIGAAGSWATVAQKRKLLDSLGILAHMRQSGNYEAIEQLHPKHQKMLLKKVRELDQTISEKVKVGSTTKSTLFRAVGGFETVEEFKTKMKVRTGTRGSLTRTSGGKRIPKRERTGTQTQRLVGAIRKPGAPAAWKRRQQLAAQQRAARGGGAGTGGVGPVRQTVKPWEKKLTPLETLELNKAKRKAKKLGRLTTEKRLGRIRDNRTTGVRDVDKPLGGAAATTYFAGTGDDLEQWEKVEGALVVDGTFIDRLARLTRVRRGTATGKDKAKKRQKDKDSPRLRDDIIDASWFHAGHSGLPEMVGPDEIQDVVFEPDPDYPGRFKLREGFKPILRGLGRDKKGNKREGDAYWEQWTRLVPRFVGGEGGEVHGAGENNAELPVRVRLPNGELSEDPVSKGFMFGGYGSGTLSFITPETRLVGWGKLAEINDEADAITKVLHGAGLVDVEAPTSIKHDGDNFANAVRAALDAAETAADGRLQVKGRADHRRPQDPDNPSKILPTGSGFGIGGSTGSAKPMAASWRDTEFGSIIDQVLDLHDSGDLDPQQLEQAWDFLGKLSDSVQRSGSREDHYLFDTLPIYGYDAVQRHGGVISLSNRASVMVLDHPVTGEEAQDIIEDLAKEGRLDQARLRELIPKYGDFH